jgi:hypothetical protein
LEDFALVLLSVCSLLSIFYKNLWPLVSVLLMVVTKQPEFVLCHGLVLNFLKRKKLKECFFIPANHFFHCLLLGILLCILIKITMLDSIFVLLIPLVYRHPVHEMMKRDSGANFLLFSLAISALVSHCLNPQDIQSLLLLNLYLYVLILFKSLPNGVIFPLVLFSAGLNVKLLMCDALYPFVLLMILFVFLFVQKMNHQKNACVKKRTAFFIHFLVVAALIKNVAIEQNFFLILMVYTWLYFAVQKICNLCIFALKCKDLTMIHTITMTPLVMMLGMLQLSGVAFSSFMPWTIFCGLAMLTLDKVTTAPMNSDSLLANPCVEDYKKLKLVSR